MKTSYFTFGQSHFHHINGFTWDKNVVCKITAENPRDVMFATFGPKWSMEYNEYEMTPNKVARFYPRGVRELEDKP